MYRQLFWVGSRRPSAATYRYTDVVVAVSAADAECTVDGGASLKLPWERRLPQMEAIVRACECFVVVARHDGRVVQQLGLGIFDEHFREQMSGSTLPGEVGVLSCIGTLRRMSAPLQMEREAPSPLAVAATIDSTPPLFCHQARSMAHMHAIEQTEVVEYDHNFRVSDEWFVDGGDAFTRDPGRRRAEVVPGGLLVDHAGSGKTATMLRYACEHTATRRLAPNHALGTVVIVPLNLPDYWVGEARTFCAGARVLRIVRGQDIRGLCMRDLLDADVVVTTLQFLKSSKRYADIVEAAVANVCGIDARDCRTAAAMGAYARAPALADEQAILEAVHWHRIVVDEVHDVFGASAMLRTLETLRGGHVWGITATPDAMGHDGEAFWRWLLSLRAGVASPQLLHRTRLQRTVCHTTDESHTYVRDLRLLTMDEETRDIIMADGETEEEVIRRCVHTPLTDDVEACTAGALIDAHESECLASAVHVQVLATEATGWLLPDAPDVERALELARTAHASAMSRALYVRRQIDELFGGTETCPICMEATCAVMVNSCGHIFCRQCITSHMARNGEQCPQCRERVGHVHGLVLDDRPWNRAACIADLLQGFGDDSSVVFLQWKSLLRNVRAVLRGRGLRVVALEGNVAQRNKSLSEHAQRGGALLLSMNESFAGLHLPHANHVVFAHALVGEPREVRALEYQAISRCVRPGQRSSEVVVHSFLLRDFVEEHMWRAVHDEYRVAM